MENGKYHLLISIFHSLFSILYSLFSILSPPQSPKESS